MNHLCIVVLYFDHISFHEFDINDSPILFRVASLALGQSYDCPSDSEVTLKYMGKLSGITTKHDLFV